MEAYEAAGGLIRRDLFGQEDDGYMQDGELLESLALEKLNERVESIREEGYAWVQVRTTFDYSDRAEFANVRTARREPTAEEQASMEALDAQMEALQPEYEAYDEDEDESGEFYAALEEKANRIQAAMDALDESLAVPDPDDAGIAGAIVTIGQSGELRIERNLIRKEDMKKRPAGEGGGGLTGIAGNGKGDAPKAAHSEKLTRMLTAYRTAAIQAAMADRPDVALAALVHRQAERVLSDGYGSGTPVKINLERVYLKPDAANIEESKAAIALAEKRRYWKNRAAAEEREGGSLFTWLLDQPQQDLLDLLALCVSLSINTVSSRENVPSETVASLMTALNLDMTQWWSVTAKSYLSHVNKERILSIVRQQVSPEVAQTMAGLKKTELVGQAAAALADSKWLPDNFTVPKLQEEQ